MPSTLSGKIHWVGWKCLILLVMICMATDAVLLPTPPMGWSTWVPFARDLSADKIMSNVAILESSGLRDKGYRWIQLDAGWYKMNATTKWVSRTNVPNIPKSTNKDGFPVLGAGAGCMLADPQKFPDGMKAFGAQLKAHGFLYSMYTSGEDSFCNPNPSLSAFYASPARYGLRETDAKCFLDWGIDALKVDICNAVTRSYSHASEVMHGWRALLPSNIVIYNSRYGCLAPVSCGRPSVGGNIYRCPFDVNFVKNRVIQPYCVQSANVARVNGNDMKPHWTLIMSSIFARIGRGRLARPGFWSDPDLVVPHETLLTFNERRSQFSVWCVLSAPLIVSVDLRIASSATLQMLGNSDAIRVDQQYFNDGGDLLRMQGVLWVFRKQLSPNEFAVVVLHAGSQYARNGPRTNAVVTWSPGSLATLVPPNAAATTNPTRCDMKSVWQDSNIPAVLHSNTTFRIASRDCVFLLLSNCG